EVSVAHIHQVRVSVREHAGLLRDRLRRAGSATFTLLVADCENTLEVVARFLALLELYREGLVEFEQPVSLDELTVRWIGGDDAGGELDIDDYEGTPAPPDAPEAPAPAAAVVVAAAPAADLRINMLGAVEIFRDPAKPFAPDAWVTRRARDILCFIASRRHRRASKDTIIDTFWGEADFAAVEKNFHPTISHIRKALNSRQPLKQNFLLYRDGDYQLNPEFSYRVDTEEFDRLVSEGDAARRARDAEAYVRAYEGAAALYRGEFMAGCYDEWAEEQRTYYREMYLRLLEILAAAAQKNEEWARSLRLAQQILREDPFREDVHCRVMRAHAALGNRVAVREQYEMLRKLLRKELGVEPAAETQRTLKELLA
ncbi:MAG TPA: segregation/condensation protein A, partial [Pyrinomonadaceae bacterium]|nr:segregation/condensation protein A [Pyrinomonadaceae bacterium]